MRLDRTLSLRVVQPLKKMGIGAGGAALPILMYHSISDDQESGTAAYYKTSTSPALFEQHLRCLNREGFRSVDLDEALRLLGEQPASREKILVITLDDGFRDFYDRAFPLLKKHGHVATVYLATAFVGDNRRSFKGKECLTWSEVRELRAHGIRFGSHTVNHPVLYDLSWTDIDRELAVSKREIEQALGEPITGFAYPYAFPQQDCSFARSFADLVRATGYQNCVTTTIGRVGAEDNRFCLKRLPVNGSDDLALLAAKLTGGYDWLAHPQSWYKTLRFTLKRRSRSRSASPPLEPCRPAKPRSSI